MPKTRGISSTVDEESGVTMSSPESLEPIEAKRRRDQLNSTSNSFPTPRSSPGSTLKPSQTRTTRWISTHLSPLSSKSSTNLSFGHRSCNETIQRRSARAHPLSSLLLHPSPPNQLTIVTLRTDPRRVVPVFGGDLPSAGKTRTGKGKKGEGRRRSARAWRLLSLPPFSA